MISFRTGKKRKALTLKSLFACLAVHKETFANHDPGLLYRRLVLKQLVIGLERAGESGARAIVPGVPTSRRRVARALWALHELINSRVNVLVSDAL